MTAENVNQFGSPQERELAILLDELVVTGWFFNSGGNRGTGELNFRFYAPQSFKDIQPKELMQELGFDDEESAKSAGLAFGQYKSPDPYRDPDTDVPLGDLPDPNRLMFQRYRGYYPQRPNNHVGLEYDGQNASAFKDLVSRMVILAMTRPDPFN